MKTMYLPRISISLALGLLFSLLAGEAKARTHNWKGPANGLWSNAANWENNDKPTSGTDGSGEDDEGGTKVVFASNTTSVCDMDVTINELDFNGSGNTLLGNGVRVLTIDNDKALNNIVSNATNNVIGGTVLAQVLPLALKGTSSTFLNANVGTLTFAANLSGDSRVTMSGPGTVVFTGINTLSNDFTVASGTLQFNTAGGVSASFIGNSLIISGGLVQLLQSDVIGDNVEIDIDAGATLDMNGKSDTIGILNVNGILKVGTGTLTTNGQMQVNQTATVTVPGGTLTCNDELGMQDATITLGTSTLTGTLNANAGLGMFGSTIVSAGAKANPDTLHLRGDVLAQTSAATDVQSFITCRVTLNGSPRSFSVANVGTQPGLVLTGIVENGSVSGSGLRKLDDGTMRMVATVANTFDGTTTVDRGVLELGNSGTPATPTTGRSVLGPVALGNTTDAQDRAILRDMTGMGGQFSQDKVLNIAKSGQLDLNGNSETFPSITGVGTIALGAGTTGSLTFGSDNSDTTYGGVFTGGGNIYKTGVGNFTFTGTFLATGTMNVQQGKMTLNTASQDQGAPAHLVIGPGVDSNNLVSVELARTNQLPDNGFVTINPFAVLDLKGFSDISGTLNVNGGTVQTGAARLETTVLLNLVGGTVSAAGGGSIVISGNMAGSVQGGVASLISGLVRLNSTPTITVTPGSVQPELVIDGAVINNVSGVPQGITKTGLGTLLMQGTSTNSYSGTTTVDRGLLQLNHTNLTNSINGPVVVGNGTDAPNTAVLRSLSSGQFALPYAFTVNASGTFDLNGFSETIASLASQGTAGGKVQMGAVNLTVGDATSTEFDGNIAGGGTFTKQGAGTLTLGGSSDLTGPTSLAAGTLLVNGSLVHSPVTVAASATLGGSGTVANATVTTTNAVVRPGLLTGGALQVTDTLNVNGGKFGVAIDDTTAQKSSRAVVNNLILSNGGTPLTFSGQAHQGPYVIASYTTLTGTFATNTLPSGYSLTYNFDDHVSTKNIAIYTPVVTLPATNVSGGNATLNGTATITAAGGSAHFEWGTDTTYGNATPTVDLGTSSGIFSVPMTFDLGSLTPNTGYHYRLVVQPAAGGTLNGSDQSFTTQDAPGAITQPASSITSAGAKLNGLLSPLGRKATYYFQYGPTTAYGSQTASLTNSASTTVPVSAVLTGLTGGRVYHFRLVGSYGVANNFSFGADLTFTTLGPIVSTLPATNVSALSATGNGTVNPNTKATTVYFEYGLTTTYGLKSVATTVPAGTSPVNVSLPMKALKYNNTYHFRIVATNVNGTSRGNDFTFTTLNVLPPNITTQPTARLVALGTSVTFTVGVTEVLPTDSIPTYQWRKANVAIPGATAATYTIPAAALINASTYDCLIKNAAGSSTSNVVQLGVVDTADKALTLAVNTKATMTVNNAGPNLLFNWTKGANTLTSDGSRITVAGKTVTINPLHAGDAGVGDSDTYTCTVSCNYAPSLTAKFVLKVFSAAPQIVTPVTMPDAIVSGTYYFKVPVSSDSTLAPTSFSVTGLPAGLKFNTTTGEVTGKPTTPKVVAGNVQPYTLSFKATNAKGGSPAATATLLINPLPTQGVGVFNGLVDRDPGLGGDFGGKINVSVTAAGTFTGSLALGASSYPLTGVLDSSTSSSTSTVTLTAKRVPPLTPMPVSLTFAIDGTNGKLTGTVTDGIIATPVPLLAWRNPWTTTNKTSLAATYTSALDIKDASLIGTDAGGNPANVAYPQGHGYATVTIAATGGVTYVGKMADGVAPATYSTTMATDGSIPVHLMLYVNTGSAHGWITATPDAANPLNWINNGLPMLDGTLDWNKNAQPAASTDRVYKAGIPKHDLTFAGGKYLAPPANTAVLGIDTSTPGATNARLTFTEGGLAGPAPIQAATMAGNLDLLITVTNKNAAVMPTPAATANPAGVTLVLTPTTGAFSGGFTLKNDPDATDTTPPTAMLSRAVTYSGLLITRKSVNQGMGFFLLNELPVVGPPKTTLLTSPKLSGEVLLKPVH